MTRPSAVRPALVLAFLLAALPALAGPAGTVKGTYTIKGKTYTAAHVYAVAKPDSFDKTKEGVELMFTVQPVEEKELFDMMPGSGPRLSASVGADGSLYGIVFLDEGTSASMSGSSIAFDKKALDATKIAGRLYSKGELEIGSTKGTFDLTFDAPLLREKKAPPPSAADKAAAAKSPQAKAYQSYLKAIHAGDVAALKKIFPAEMAAMTEKPEFKEQLGFVKEMTPKSVDYLRVTESGDKATLEVETKTDLGTVDCVKEGGVWKIGQQSWKNK